MARASHVKWRYTKYLGFSTTVSMKYYYMYLLLTQLSEEAEITCY